MKFKEKENRPWGSFYVIHDEINYKLKRIEVNPSSRLSYQYHNKRSECWTIVQGSGIITIDGVDKKISNGESIKIEQGSKHRIYNNTSSYFLTWPPPVSYCQNSLVLFRLSSALA